MLALVLKRSSRVIPVLGDLDAHTASRHTGLAGDTGRDDNDVGASESSSELVGTSESGDLGTGDVSNREVTTMPWCWCQCG
jgi:hypothetical protein